MVFGLRASRLAQYNLPIGETRFYKPDGSKDTEMVNAYRDSTEIMFFNTMISAYLVSIRRMHYITKIKQSR
jgi:hypothetical protein